MDFFLIIISPGTDKLGRQAGGVFFFFELAEASGIWKATSYRNTNQTVASLFALVAGFRFLCIDPTPHAKLKGAFLFPQVG